jgi:hypothetical protein
MVHDLEAYKRAKARLIEYEPYFNNLCKFSDYLFKNLHLPGVFDILEEIESQKIEYYIEISECKRILNSKAKKTEFKPKLIIITESKND